MLITCLNPQNTLFYRVEKNVNKYVGFFLILLITFFDCFIHIFLSTYKQYFCGKLYFFPVIFRFISEIARLTSLFVSISVWILSQACITVVWSLPPNTCPILGKDIPVSSLQRNIATCLGKAISRDLFFDFSCSGVTS